jgi:uncharacterized protein (DUF1778 family)
METDDKRLKRITIRVTEQEYETLSEAAKKGKTTVSRFVRKKLFYAPIRLLR